MLNDGECCSRQPKPECKSHQLNEVKKKLMEKQTICTNDANTNENIYYFIHVWRTTPNKLWQNFHDKKYDCSIKQGVSFVLSFFLSVRFPFARKRCQKWQKHEKKWTNTKQESQRFWSQARQHEWWRWNPLIKVEQSSNNWNGVKYIDWTNSKYGWRHWSRIFPYWF